MTSVLLVYYNFIYFRFEDENTFNVEPGGSDSGPSYQPQVFVNPLTSDHFPALGGGAANNSNNITLVSKNYTRFSNAAFNSNDFPSLGKQFLAKMCG